MNGAAIPLILWYFVTFTPEIPMAPIVLYGPYENEELCKQQEREQIFDKDHPSWCQGLVIRKPKERK